MNKKSVLAVLAIVLLAAVLVLGLPVMADRIKQRAESAAVTVTATPFLDFTVISFEELVTPSP